MNISIKGTLSKNNKKWILHMPILDDIHCDSPLKCLKQLELKIRLQLQDENIECFYKVDDDGVIYLLTTNTDKMIEYIAQRLINLDAFRMDLRWEED
jgi:hypothetical protein